MTHRVYSVISPRRRRTRARSSVRSRMTPTAVSSAPAPARITVHTTVSRRIACTLSAAASNATPARKISPERKERSISAAPRQVAGTEGEGDRADDEKERHRFGSHQALDEVREMLGEREIAEEAAQDVRPLEALQMADEPEPQQRPCRDQRGHDLVVRQRREELTDGQTRHPKQYEPDIAGENRRRLGGAEQ